MIGRFFKTIASVAALGIGLAAAGLLLDEGRWINGQRVEAAGGIFL